MALETSVTELAKAFWEWVKRDLNTWIRAMGDLKSVLAEHDLESAETLIYAVRFSAFSIVLALLTGFPAIIFFLPHGITLNQTVSLIVLSYVMAVLFAVAAKFMAILVRSKTPLRTCFVMALFSTVYWSLNSLLVYITYSDRNLMRFSYFGDFDPNITYPAGFFVKAASAFVIAIFLYGYIFLKLISATRFVFRTDWFRAVIIVFGTGSIEQACQFWPLRPIFEAATNAMFSG